MRQKHFIDFHKGITFIYILLLISYYNAFNNTTKIDYINYMAYMDGVHKYMFDEENLLHILKTKGFNDVKLRVFDSQIDLKSRDYESIYAQGIK